MKLTIFPHILVIGMFAIPSEGTNGIKFGAVNYGYKESKLHKLSSYVNKMNSKNSHNGSLFGKGRYKTINFDNNHSKRVVPILSNSISFQIDKLDHYIKLEVFVPEVKKTSNQTNYKSEINYTKEEPVTQSVEIEKEYQERQNIFMNLDKLDEDDALAVLCDEFLSKAP